MKYQIFLIFIILVFQQVESAGSKNEINLKKSTQKTILKKGLQKISQKQNQIQSSQKGQNLRLQKNKKQKKIAQQQNNQDQQSAKKGQAYYDSGSELNCQNIDSKIASDKQKINRRMRLAKKNKKKQVVKKGQSYYDPSTGLNCSNIDTQIAVDKQKQQEQVQIEQSNQNNQAKQSDKPENIQDIPLMNAKSIQIKESNSNQQKESIQQTEPTVQKVTAKQEQQIPLENQKTVQDIQQSPQENQQTPQQNQQTPQQNQQMPQENNQTSQQNSQMPQENQQNQQTSVQNQSEINKSKENISQVTNLQENNEQSQEYQKKDEAFPPNAYIKAKSQNNQDDLMQQNNQNELLQKTINKADDEDDEDGDDDEDDIIGFSINEDLSDTEVTFNENDTQISDDFIVEDDDSQKQKSKPKKLKKSKEQLKNFDVKKQDLVDDIKDVQQAILNDNEILSNSTKNQTTDVTKQELNDNVNEQDFGEEFITKEEEEEQREFEKELMIESQQNTTSNTNILENQQNQTQITAPLSNNSIIFQQNPSKDQNSTINTTKIQSVIDYKNSTIQVINSTLNKANNSLEVNNTLLQLISILSDIQNINATQKINQTQINDIAVKNRTIESNASQTNVSNKSIDNNTTNTIKIIQQPIEINDLTEQDKQKDLDLDQKIKLLMRQGSNKISKNTNTFMSRFKSVQGDPKSEPLIHPLFMFTKKLQKIELANQLVYRQHQFQNKIFNNIQSQQLKNPKLLNLFINSQDKIIKESNLVKDSLKKIKVSMIEFYKENLEDQLDDNNENRNLIEIKTQLLKDIVRVRDVSEVNKYQNMIFQQMRDEALNVQNNSLEKQYGRKINQMNFRQIKSGQKQQKLRLIRLQIMRQSLEKINDRL